MRNFSKKSLVLFLLLAAVATATGWFLVREARKTGESLDRVGFVPVQIPKKPVDDTDLVDTSKWKTYRNEEYGFELKYPEEWMLTEHPKNQYGEILSLASEDTKKEQVGMLNQFGDNITIRYLNSINDDTHLQYASIKVSNLEEFLNLDKSITEVMVLKKIKFLNRNAYLIGTMGFTGHYSIIFETEKRQIIQIIFEKTIFSEERDGLINDIEKEITLKDRAVIESLHLVK